MLMTLLLLASASLLVLAVFLLVVPAWCVRAAALAVTVAVVVAVGNNSAPPAAWVAGFVFSAVLLLVAVARGGLERRVGGVPFLLVSGLWAWLAVGALVAGSYSVPRLVVYFGLAVVVALVAGQLSRREVHLVLGAVVAVAVVQVGLAVAELALGEPLLWGLRGGTRPNPFLGDAVDRVQGTLGHPIILGLLEGLAVLLVWADPWQLSRRARWALLAVCAGGVLLSGTRSIAACLVVAVGVHLLLRSRLAAWLRNVAIAAVVGSGVLLLDLGLSEIVDDLLASGSWVHRLESVQAVPALLARPLAESLWGTGFGSEVGLFRDGHIRLTFGLEVVDNFYVYLLGTTGVLGLSAFLLVAVVTFARGDRLTRAVVVLFLGMGASFDLVVWLGVGVLMSLFFALPGAAALAASDRAEQAQRAGRDREDASVEDDPAREDRRPALTA
jgi:hypothetical protein